MDEEIKNEPDDDFLSEWLDELKPLLLDLSRKSRILADLCPYLCPDNERKIKLKELAELEKSIGERIERMRKIEASTDHAIGCSALLGCSPVTSEPTFLAICVLAAVRLHAGLRSECRTVGDVMMLAAGSCPVDSLEVRDLFRSPDGMLCPWVRLSSEFNVDSSAVDFAEASFSVLCGRQPTDREYALGVLGMTDNPSRKTRVI